MRKPWVLAPIAAVGAVAARDVMQRDRAILRNFPVVGRARFWLESIGPELRQYVVAGNDEERPFSRDQRRWVYASAKLQNNYFGFGTDNDLEHSVGTIVMHHRTIAPSARLGRPTEQWVRRLGCRRPRCSAGRAGEELLNTLADGRMLDEVYGYQPGWGYPSVTDRSEIIKIMEWTDEEEAATEGPPETSEEGEPSAEIAGDLPASEE